MSDPITIAFDDDKTLFAMHGKPKEGALLELEHKLVLMIHGFPGHHAAHDNLYGNLEFLLNDKGFHTLRFDFFGCGKSSGEEEEFSLTRAKDSLDAIKEWADHNGYKKLIFISDGLGSIAALMNMELSLTCQVLLWPALHPPKLSNTLFGADNISDEAQQRGYVSSGEHKVGLRFISELSKINMKPYFRDVTMPVLILHGTQDDLYPIEQLDLARKYITSKRIEITTFHDGEHGLPSLNHRKSMFFHITQFLEKFA